MKNTVRTALIIDDDPDFCFLFSFALEQIKVRTMTIQTLVEAEHCLNYLKPTFIFLDNNFPDGLGINFINYIKTVDQEIKIIMITADPAPWIKEKAIEKGIDVFLSKPFSIETVKAVIGKISKKTA